MPEVCLPAAVPPPPAPRPQAEVQEYLAPGPFRASGSRPLDFRFQWLRETVRGLTRNALPFEFYSGVEARIHYEWLGPLRLRTWRAGGLYHAELHGGDEPAPARVHVDPWPVPPSDPLLPALLGVHPVLWFREALIGTGSGEWFHQIAVQHVRGRTLERLAEKWAQLDPHEEAVAWRSLSGDGAAAFEAIGRDRWLFPLLVKLHDYSRCLDDPATWPDWVHNRISEFLGENQKLEMRLEGWRRKTAEFHHLASHAAAELLLARPATGLLARGTFRSAAALDEALRTGAGLEAEAPPRLVIDLELPFRSRHSVRCLSDYLASTPLHIEHGGRVVADPPEARRASAASTARAVLLPLAAQHAHRGERWETAPDSVFTANRSIRNAVDWDDWRRLLETYGLAAPADPGEAGEASLTITLPGRYFAPWLHTPSPRHPSYHELFGRVAMRVQKVLRTWIPACWFTSAERFSDTHNAYPLLAYAATPAAQDLKATGLLPDPSRPGVLNRLREAVRLSADPVRRSVFDHLTVAGELAAARSYTQDCTPEIARSLQRRSKLYIALLRREHYVMDELMRLPGQVRQLQRALDMGSAKAGHLMATAAADIVHDLDKHLRGPAIDESAPMLGQLLLMEAACALGGHDLFDAARVTMGFESRGFRRVWALQRASNRPSGRK